MPAVALLIKELRPLKLQVIKGRLLALNPAGHTLTTKGMHKGTVRLDANGCPLVNVGVRTP